LINSFINFLICLIICLIDLFQTHLKKRKRND
jgi:hypothetical protein